MMSVASLLFAKGEQQWGSYLSSSHNECHLRGLRKAQSAGFFEKYQWAQNFRQLPAGPIFAFGRRSENR
jgi:hypothetical protein